MAARQETAISADTEATGHLTATPQEATTHTAIQAVILQALHAHTQAAQAQALVLVLAQGLQALVAAEAVHAAVAASVAEAEEDKSCTMYNLQCTIH